jgi:hypothetical protein
MKINIFRVGRWLEAILIALWMVGCLLDISMVGGWNAERPVLLTLIGVIFAGVATIMFASWAIGRTVRRALRIPRGRDFRDDQTEAF